MKAGHHVCCTCCVIIRIPQVLSSPSKVDPESHAGCRTAHPI